jgi:GAF domain-containing protein
MAATEAHMGNLQLSDPQTRTLKIQVHRGFTEGFLLHFDSIPEDAAACGAAFQQGGPVVVDDITRSPLFSVESRKALIAAGVAAVQSLALIDDGQKLGCVSVHYRQPGIPQFSREAFASTARLTAQIVAASQPAAPKSRTSSRPPN